MGWLIFDAQEQHPTMDLNLANAVLYQAAVEPFRHGSSVWRLTPHLSGMIHLWTWQLKAWAC